MLPVATQMTIEVCQEILGTLHFIWTFTGIGLFICKTLGRRRPAALNLTWYWCKWPALASVLLNPIFLSLLNEFKWYTPLLFIFQVWLWWYYRNMGDDDDHKKLKRKLKEKVQALGGKLVVRPA